MRNFLMRTIKIRFWLLLVVQILFASAVSAQSDVVLVNNFEKDVQGWENRGAATISVSKDQAAGGAKSLKVSGRREFWQGAQLNVTKVLKANTTYKFTLSIRLGKGEKPDDVKMTMQKGDNGYEQIAAANAGADGWTTLSGKFKSAGGDPCSSISKRRDRTLRIL